MPTSLANLYTMANPAYSHVAAWFGVVTGGGGPGIAAYAERMGRRCLRRKGYVRAGPMVSMTTTTTTSAVLMMLLLMVRTYVGNGADRDDAGAGGADDADRDDDA